MEGREYVQSGDGGSGAALRDFSSTVVTATSHASQTRTCHSQLTSPRRRHCRATMTQYPVLRRKRKQSSECERSISCCTRSLQLPFRYSVFRPYGLPHLLLLRPSLTLIVFFSKFSTSFALFISVRQTRSTVLILHRQIAGYIHVIPPLASPVRRIARYPK